MWSSRIFIKIYGSNWKFIYKYLINSIFVGISSTNLKCKNSNCENVKQEKKKLMIFL